METETQIIPREKRFEVADLTGFDAIVSRADAEEHLFFAQLIDFSRTGVKFTVPFFAKFDEFLKIEFKFKNSSLHYVGTGRVRHIRNVEPSRWQVGCSIDPPVPDDVVAYLVKTTNQERRRFERVEVEGQGSLLRQGTIEGCDASLINVSEGGLCLSVDQEHETGQRVDFRIENQKGSEEVIAARVRWQSNVDGGYRLGCSFADSTSHTKLVDCLVEKQQAAEGDRVNWLVAATIMFAMFLPPAAYFLFGTGSNKSQSGNVAQIEEVGIQSENELLRSSETQSTPAEADSLATRANDIHHQQNSTEPRESTDLQIVTARQTAVIEAPAVQTPTSLGEQIPSQLADIKHDSRQEPDFRQPWGEPPEDLAPAIKHSGTTGDVKQSEIQQPEIAANPSPAAKTSPAVNPLPAAISDAPPNPNNQIKASGSRRNSGTDTSHASARIAHQPTSKPANSKSQISKSQISNTEVFIAEIPKTDISNLEISNSDVSQPDNTKPVVSKSPVSSPLPIDQSILPKPPRELLASGPKKVRILNSSSPPGPEALQTAKNATSVGLNSKPAEASSRRQQKTQPLQVPSEVISKRRSGH